MPLSSPMWPPSDPLSMTHEATAHGGTLSRWDPEQATTVDDALLICARILGDAQVAIDDVLVALSPPQRAEMRPVIEATRQRLRAVYTELLRQRTARQC